MSVTSARGCFYKHSFFYQRCDVAQCRIGRAVAYLGPFATGQRSFKAVIQMVNYLPLTLVEFGVGMAVPIWLFCHYNSCGKYTNYSPQNKASERPCGRSDALFMPSLRVITSFFVLSNHLHFGGRKLSLLIILSTISVYNFQNERNLICNFRIVTYEDCLQRMG